MKKKNKDRVILTELSMTGVFHSGINAAFLQMMHEAYPEAELFFYAERAHIDSCSRQAGSLPVGFRKFPFFPKATKYTLPLRDILGVIYITSLLLVSRKNDLFCVTNLLPLTHWCFVLWNRLFRRRGVIVLHGQLEAFLPDTALRYTKMYFRLHGPLLRRDKRNHYVVLGEPVYNAVKHFFGEKTRTIVLDHPYIPLPREVIPPYEFPLKFGQIGVGNPAKGTDQLFRLGELLQQEIRNGKVELSLLGCLDREMRSRTNPWVKWFERPLTDAELEHQALELHYTLFFRNASQGRATASGSFFDTIRYRKPFLSLENNFVTYYARRFPGCGELCRSVEDMAEAIRKIILHTDAEPYRHRISRLRLMQHGLSTVQLAERFKKSLETK